jgi:hypothetical protein
VPVKKTVESPWPDDPFGRDGQSYQNVKNNPVGITNPRLRLGAGIAARRVLSGVPCGNGIGGVALDEI